MLVEPSPCWKCSQKWAWPLWIAMLSEAVNPPKKTQSRLIIMTKLAPPFSWLDPTLGMELRAFILARHRRCCIGCHRHATYCTIRDSENIICRLQFPQEILTLFFWWKITTLWWSVYDFCVRLINNLLKSSIAGKGGCYWMYCAVDCFREGFRLESD